MCFMKVYVYVCKSVYVYVCEYVCEYIYLYMDEYKCISMYMEIWDYMCMSLWLRCKWIKNYKNSEDGIPMLHYRLTYKPLQIRDTTFFY